MIRPRLRGVRLVYGSAVKTVVLLAEWGAYRRERLFRAREGGHLNTPEILRGRTPVVSWVDANAACPAGLLGFPEEVVLAMYHLDRDVEPALPRALMSFWRRWRNGRPWEAMVAKDDPAARLLIAYGENSRWNLELPDGRLHAK